MLAKDPDRRPQTMADVSERIKRTAIFLTAPAEPSAEEAQR
jgi:hypothetical protein